MEKQEIGMREIRILEFDAIREMLCAQAASEMGKDLCRKLVPVYTLWEAKNLQTETAEAVAHLFKTGYSPVALGSVPTR